MRSEHLGKTLVLLFVVVLFFYITVFMLDQHLRSRKGPWEVSFRAGQDDVPVLTIDQPAVGVTNFSLIFTNETVRAKELPVTVRFDQPRQAVPFGEVIYDDLTYLPGIVTFEMFGHPLELSPRTLIVGKKEHAWEPNGVLVIGE